MSTLLTISYLKTHRPYAIKIYSIVSLRRFRSLARIGIPMFYLLVHYNNLLSCHPIHICYEMECCISYQIERKRTETINYMYAALFRKVDTNVPKTDWMSSDRKNAQTSPETRIYSSTIKSPHRKGLSTLKL